jgi:hypothetical protein
MMKDSNKKVLPPFQLFTEDIDATNDCSDDQYYNNNNNIRRRRKMQCGVSSMQS